MVKQLLIIVLGLISVNVWSQISHGGQPMLLNEQVEPISLMPARTAMASQVQSREQGKLPLRFAEAIYTNFTPQNSGQWEVSATGYNVWRLAIKSEGAKSLNLIFDKFCLFDDDKLFVYNPQRSHVLGAFTKENNKPSKIFAVAPVAGDELIVELQTKNAVDFPFELEVSAVNHDFLGVHKYLKRKSDFGDSGLCNINASCESICSDEIRRSVCKIISDGVYLCSGTMLNSSVEEGNPLFLTAGHCTTNTSGVPFDYTAQTIIFFFNYESFSCEPVVNGVDAQTVSGAELLAYVENMDFALLQMGETPKDNYRPYLAGWTRAENIDNTVFSVHHPQGDVKKIAVSAAAPVNATYNAKSYGDVSFLENIHWQIALWDRGVTEGGSSGSGLFTEDQLFIGNLSGGEAYCGNPYNDYYVRFNQAWNYNSEKNKSLVQWLSPDDVNRTQMIGRELSSYKRVSHLNNERTANVLYDNKFIGSWSGHNERGYTAYASSFYDVESATISGVYLVPAKVESSSQTINVTIWDNNNGKPGDVLWSQENIQLNSVYENSETLIELAVPLELNNAFFAGIELSYSASVDTFGIYMSDLSAEEGLNRAYIRQSDGQWVAFSDVHSSGKKASYWVDVLAADPVFVSVGDKPTSIKRNYVNILNHPIKNRTIQFNSDVKDLRTVDVYALNGQVVKTYVIQNPAKDAFSVHGIPQGVYLLKFSSSTEVIVKKVLIVD
ncbi:T9SS type A sorting domain-containing protein [Carboxylicivirga mesophila]|uniref:T9SS type A sorting domain-containing protein n=1 Tax=Carboxylicivirga mesophila TaxID=1166478 RepID=A0ABS5KDV3_9BACT|nr:trypsin-like peptidase domain-containing protein [Carboxylicivirga mesophila]MBS2213216.1 T9SS type A sorting domain-containing protein [Carboxylicivirga mesophila]